MNQELFWLGRAGLASAVLCLTALVGGGFGSDDSPGRVALRQRLVRLDRKLRLLRWRLSARLILLIQALALSVALTVAVGLHVWPLAAAALGTLVLPGFVVNRATSKRTDRLCDQIEGWILVLANALKGSASLGEAIASSVGLISEPLRSEVELVVKEFSLGTPLDSALDNLGTRIGTNIVQSTVLALRVARRSGGDLPRMLEMAAGTLRELARLEGVVRSKTAEGRAQTWVIACVPFVMIAVVEQLHPGFFRPLVTNLVGNLLVIAASGLWTAALLAARKILQVDI